MKTQIYSKSHLISLLKEWAQKHGETPSKRQWNEDASTPSDIPYRLRFGSWGNALKIAALKIKDRPHKGRPRGSRNKKHERVLAQLTNAHYLALTKNGSPCHPLYLRNELQPKPFSAFTEISNDGKGGIMDNNICGLCGEHGADKIPHPVYWPGEQRPGTDLVHAECEDEECKRAHEALSPQERETFLQSIR